MPKHFDRDSLRVVHYTRQAQDGFNPDDSKKAETIKGYFHAWGEKPTKSPHDDSYYNETIAYVENDETGAIEEVFATCITFVV